MDQYQLIASMLWTGFGLSLIALMVGLVMAQTTRRKAALAVLFIGLTGTLLFSFIAGFSIGRLTAAIPLLITGYAAGMGRGRTAVGLCLLGAAVTYLLFSWLLTPLEFNGGVLALLFGFWAIPTNAVIAVAAFGWAFANPPRAHPDLRTG